MSNVKIQGNVSGTGSLTIAAPNTNSDRTLTLPDQTGTLMATGGGPINVSTSAPDNSVVVNAAGNLGLGVTPSAWGEKALQVGPNAAVSSSSAISSFSSNVYWTGSYSGQTYINNGYANAYLNVSGEHRWYNAPSGTAGNAISFTQAMTLDSSGNLLVGTTTNLDVNAQRLQVKTSTAGAWTGWMEGVDRGLLIKSTNSSSFAMYFLYNTTAVGSITTSTTSTSYNTSSDYRLKNTIAPMTGALAKVAALKPCTYKWNADGSDGEGFIAHELAEVAPQCVTGEKDAVDADGNPVYQGIDTSFLIATLTAAIQEQQALITQLQADVAALKGAA